jgi:hypothetical protein
MTAKSHTDTLAQPAPDNLRKALEDCLGCVVAAEAEGLHETINSLRDSEHFDTADVFRLIDLVERRLMWVREYAAPALAAMPPAAPVETATKSAPSLLASQHAELLPKREPAGGGADTIADQNLLLRSNEIKLDATVRIFRKALQHVSDQRWNEEATVERLCDHADNTLEREVKANDPVTPVKDRRSVWLRMALYNIQIGRCHDPREHARKALEDDDLLASLSSDEPQGARK